MAELTPDHGNEVHDRAPHNIPTAHPSHEHEEGGLVKNIPALIGLVIVLIIVIWGLVNLVSLSGSWFSSFFYKPPAGIQVSAPANATSGVPFTVSWKYSPSVKGSYAFLYQCQNDLSMSTQGATSTYLGVPCGIAYTIGTSGNSFSLMPKLSGSNPATSTITIVFIPSETGSRAQGSATITVHPSAPVAPAVQKPSPQPTATRAPKRTYYTAPHASGPADLAVRIVSSGVNADGSGFVTFDIGNIGGSTSGAYSFFAQLPTATPAPYTSAIQTPLSPGSHVINTLSFTDVAPGGGTFTVEIGGDSNAGNNYASIFLSNPVQTYNAYTPTPYTVYPSATY